LDLDPARGRFWRKAAAHGHVCCWMQNEHATPLGRGRLLTDIVAKVESCIGPNFGQIPKREAINDSYNLSRVIEVAYEFSERR
jgi:hypothetical protein